MVRVKICGITNLLDAESAVGFGADALGFIFYKKSPRCADPKKVRQIVQAVGPFVLTVGVFVDEKPSEMLRIARLTGIGAIQLHGHETPATIKKLAPYPVIKVIHVGLDQKNLPRIAYPAHAYLFDTQIGAVLGGTGKVFDWRLLKKLTGKTPAILSGGLNPKNISRAVREVRPYGVDVSSGVEKHPGKKDLKLLKEFIQNAKKA